MEIHTQTSQEKAQVHIRAVEILVGTLANISGKQAVKAFAKDGWIVRGQVGSHVLMTKPDMRANLSVPQHKELAAGTLRQLIRAAGLSVDRFLELL